MGNHAEMPLLRDVLLLANLFIIEFVVHIFCIFSHPVLISDKLGFTSEKLKLNFGFSLSLH